MALRGTVPVNDYAPQLHLAFRLAATEAQLEQELRTPRNTPNPTRHMTGMRANLDRTRAMRQEVARQLGEEVTIETLAPFVQLTRLSVAALLRRTAVALREEVIARLDLAAASLDDGGTTGTSLPDLAAVVRVFVVLMTGCTLIVQHKYTYRPKCTHHHASELPVVPAWSCNVWVH